MVRFIIKGKRAARKAVTLPVALLSSPGKRADQIRFTTISLEGWGFLLLTIAVSTEFSLISTKFANKVNSKELGFPDDDCTSLNVADLDFGGINLSEDTESH